MVADSHGEATYTKQHKSTKDTHVRCNRKEESEAGGRLG